MMEEGELNLKYYNRKFFNFFLINSNCKINYYKNFGHVYKLIN